MSSQPAPALVPQPEPQLAPKEIPELTDAYRKAHKSYVLASGLLASWELIGITLQTKEKWGIELKSPAAVPLILLTLVVYSGYKMTIEWLQCHPHRQNHPVAKFDNRIAHAIAFIAIAVSIVQYLLQIQILDVLIHHRKATELALHTFLIALLLASILSVNSPILSSRPLRIAIPAAIIVVLFALDALAGRSFKITIIAASIGYLAGFLREWIPGWYKRRTKSNSTSTAS